MASDPETLIYRAAILEDVPALFAVRVATRENTYTLAELAVLGITEQTVGGKLRGSYGGWVCEAAGRVVGFSMADRSTGELWVIAVLPEFEGRGVGARLMALAEEWLWSCGCEEAWLTTSIDPGLRAYGFYRKLGWTDHEIRGGLRYLKKVNPATRP